MEKIYVGMAFALLIVHDAYAAQRRSQRRPQLKEWISREAVLQCGFEIADKDQKAEKERAVLEGMIQTADRYLFVVKCPKNLVPYIVNPLKMDGEWLDTAVKATLFGVTLLYGCVLGAFAMYDNSYAINISSKICMVAGSPAMMLVAKLIRGKKHIDRCAEYVRQQRCYLDPEITEFYALDGVRKKREITHVFLAPRVIPRNIIYKATHPRDSEDVPLLARMIKGPWGKSMPTNVQVG